MSNERVRLGVGSQTELGAAGRCLNKKLAKSVPDMGSLQLLI